MMQKTKKKKRKNIQKKVKKKATKNKNRLLEGMPSSTTGIGFEGEELFFSEFYFAFFYLLGLLG